MIDVIIIGAGPSGISAALELKKLGRQFLLIEKAIPGGRLHTYHQLDNFSLAKDAQVFASSLMQIMQESGVESTYGDVQSIHVQDGVWQVISDMDQYQANVILLATGTSDKKLNIPGEDTFLGRGVSFCAECDGSFFKNKDVAVIGDTNHAYKEVKHLSTIAQTVYWIKAHPSDLTMQKDAKVVIINQALPVRIEGTQSVESLCILVQSELKRLSVSAVFPCLGVIANKTILDKLTRHTDNPHLLINKDYQTQFPGLYAIGDVRDQSPLQLQAAIDDGVKVVSYIETYLKNK
jgi:thioredoxin reductase (NADPH)